MISSVHCRKLQVLLNVLLDIAPVINSYLKECFFFFVCVCVTMLDLPSRVS